MTISALTEAEAKTMLTKAMARLDQIKVWQKTYYDKKKDDICRRNREAYTQNKESILARRRTLYNSDPARRLKRREAYLRQKASKVPPVA